MDFTHLDTRSGAEKGAELHLRHPVLGHLLYSGDGANVNGEWTDRSKSPARVGVIVRGLESSSVQERVRRVKRSAVSGKDDMEADIEVGTAMLHALVIGFFGLTKDGKPMESTEENKRAFFDQSYKLGEQVINFAKENANFFVSASTD